MEEEIRISDVDKRLIDSGLEYKNVSSVCLGVWKHVTILILSRLGREVIIIET